MLAFAWNYCSQVNILEVTNNADVLLDSGLNLFNIIVNLCSKLYYEVLLRSGNYTVNLLKQTVLCLGLE